MVSVTGIYWHPARPAVPSEGDAFYDSQTRHGYIFHNGKWQLFSSDGTDKERFVPTPEELEKHPSLKEAWDEYLVIKRLIGI